MIIIIAQEKAPEFNEKLIRKILEEIKVDFYSKNRSFTPNQLLGAFTDRFYDRNNMHRVFFEPVITASFPNLYMEDKRFGNMFIGNIYDKKFMTDGPCPIENFYFYSPPFDVVTHKAIGKNNAIVHRRVLDKINIEIEKFCFATHDVEQLTQGLKTLHAEFIKDTQFFFKNYVLKFNSDDINILEQCITYIVNYTKPKYIK